MDETLTVYLGLLLLLGHGDQSGKGHQQLMKLRVNLDESFVTVGIPMRAEVSSDFLCLPPGARS
jgi:hypothetical protein